MYERVQTSTNTNDKAGPTIGKASGKPKSKFEAMMEFRKA